MYRLQEYIVCVCVCIVCAYIFSKHLRVSIVFLLCHKPKVQARDLS
jgi:hypothetical protein